MIEPLNEHCLRTDCTCRNHSRNKCGQPTVSFVELKRTFHGYINQMKENSEQLQDMLSSNTNTESFTNQKEKTSVNEVVSTQDNGTWKGRSGSTASTISGRPTTSRGKPHPSPNEFFDYVVPSPVCKSSKFYFFNIFNAYAFVS
jgi:hypothetical protein